MDKQDFARFESKMRIGMFFITQHGFRHFAAAEILKIASGSP